MQRYSADGAVVIAMAARCWVCVCVALPLMLHTAIIHRPCEIFTRYLIRTYDTCIKRRLRTQPTDYTLAYKHTCKTRSTKYSQCTKNFRRIRILEKKRKPNGRMTDRWKDGTKEIFTHAQLNRLRSGRMLLRTAPNGTKERTNSIAFKIYLNQKGEEREQANERRMSAPPKVHLHMCLSLISSMLIETSFWVPVGPNHSFTSHRCQVRKINEKKVRKMTNCVSVCRCVVNAPATAAY